MSFFIDQPTKLFEYFDNLKPNQKFRQENGEVFTPMSLVFEMLDKLDEYYFTKKKRSIFTEAKFKWGDIAGSGLGSFSVGVYLRLMKGLEQKMPDSFARKQHILSNMIYMAELNPDNVKSCKNIFGPDINIYEGDALELNPSVWQIEKFDVILGNPPFNCGGIRSCTGKLLGEKNKTIWPDFVVKSLEMLKPSGYLAFIHPLSWLRKSHYLHHLLTLHIIWLKLWDSSYSFSMINANIPISLYVLKNSKSHKETYITYENRTEKLTSCARLNATYSVPLAYHELFAKLITFIENNNLKLDYKTKVVKSTGERFKLPKNYFLDDAYAVDTYTIKDGILVKKAVHPDANKRKLIIANKRSFRGAFIDDGRLGLTGSHKFYILGDNLELLQKMLSFKVFDYVALYTKYGQDFLDSCAFDYVPDVRKLNISTDDFNECLFYKMIKY